MVIKIKPKEAPPKYLFGKAARQQQAAKAHEENAEQAAPAAQPAPPVAVQGSSFAAWSQRSTMKSTVSAKVLRG